MVRLVIWDAIAPIITVMNNISEKGDDNYAQEYVISSCKIIPHPLICWIKLMDVS